MSLILPHPLSISKRGRTALSYSYRNETGGIRGYEGFQVGEEVNLNSNWSKIEKSFKLSGKVKGEEFGCSFGFSLTGQGNFSIDDISLIEE